MGKYKFYQDRKVTSWERDYFSVKANSYEEAEAIVRSWNCEDVSNIIDNRLCYEEWQALTDTSEFMLPEENDGNPTIEIFNQDGESIMTNVPETPNQTNRTMNVTIEHVFCRYSDEAEEIYFRIMNTILLSVDETELRASMERLKNETPLDEYFIFGYGAHHIWINQRRPSNKNRIFKHRIMVAHF